jgi:tetratricopeptide (TPR) repeat protein
MRNPWSQYVFTIALIVASSQVRAESALEPTQGTGTLDDAARREQAKTLFERGVSLYRDERYKEALNYFIGAQNLYPNNTLTFNIASTCERLDDAPCALRYYREYRRNAQNAKDLDEVDRHVATMERVVATKGVQQVTLFSKPVGAMLLVDGVEKGTTPWTGELTPGQHTALMKQAGFSDLQVAFLVEAAHAADWTYVLRPAPAAQPVTAEPEQAVAPQAPVASAQRQPAPAPIAPDRRSTVGTWTWLALGSGAAALGTAGILEAMRSNRENAVRGSATQLDRTAAYESMQDYQKAARITVGAGLVLTTAGLTLLTLDLTRHKKSGANVSASCVGKECRLGLAGVW